jgi:DUF1016 N-terminal domain
MSDQPVSLTPTDYAALLGDIKQRVRHAQARAMLAVNAELIRLYWDIGALIHARQQQEGWGAAVIPRLTRDLHNELPEEKGFSERNIKRMLAFYREYAGLEFVPQPVALIEPGRLIWAIEGAQMTATQPSNNPIQVTSTCDGMAI